LKDFLEVRNLGGIAKVRFLTFNLQLLQKFKDSFVFRTYSQTDNSWYVYPYLKHEFDLLGIDRDLKYELIFDGKFYDIEFRELSVQNYFKLVDWLKKKSFENPKIGNNPSKIFKLEKIWESFKKDAVIDYSRNRVLVPLTYGKARALVIVGEYLFEPGTVEELDKWSKWLKERVLESKSYKTDKIVKLPGGKLFEFQARAFEVANERLNEYGSVLIADEMGIGKTIQSLAIVFHKKSFPTLVICPASLKYNWKHEIMRFLKIPQNEISVIEGTNSSFIRARLQTAKNLKFVIINYDIVHHHVNTLKSLGFKSVILDEAHYIKNRKAKRTQAIKKLSEIIPVKIFLSGTPIMNNPEEILSVLEITDLLKYFGGNISNFQKRYIVYKIGSNRRGKVYRKIEGFKNLKDLNQRLRATIMIRREKKDIIKELPEKIITPQWIKLEEKDYKEYEKVKNAYEYDFVTLIEILIQEGKIKPHVVPKSIFETRNNELAEEWLIAKYPNFFMSEFSKLYEMLGKLKVKYVVKFVKEKMEEDKNRKIVVFAYHKEVQKELLEKFEKLGYNPLKIFAEDTPIERASAVSKFQNDEKHRVIVLSLMAAKEGLTLTRADTAIFTELYFNPQVLAQAEDRIHRVGQKSIANIYYFIAENTIDEKIWEQIIEPKKEMFKNAVVL